MPEQDRRTDEAHAAPQAVEGASDAKSLAANDSEGDGSIDFLQLAQGRREVLVRLAGQTYRLRWTRNDKLILTK
jgi:hemin uptake protein HemP